jgi:hypothetical protein
LIVGEDVGVPRMPAPPPTRLLRSGRGPALTLFVLFALGLAAVATAGIADAHTHLVKISPALGSTLTTPPSAVVLTFSEPLGTGFATVRVTDGTGREVGAGSARVAGAVVTQPLRADLASGPYAVAFRVVSSDGHPVADVSAFTLELAGGAGPTPSAGVPTASPAPSGSGSASDPQAAGHSGHHELTGSAAGGDPAATTPLRRLAMAVGVGALALAIGTTLVAVSRRKPPA